MNGVFLTTKTTVCGFLGTVGALIAAAFGGWDAGMRTLITVMAIDYITGLICAGVFKASKKSSTGGLNSKVGWKGLCKKGVTLLIVLVACRLDEFIGTDYIRDFAIIAYVANEILSITENAGLMGVPIPDVIKRAIDILRKNSEEEENEKQELQESEDTGDEDSN